MINGIKPYRGLSYTASPKNTTRELISVAIYACSKSRTLINQCESVRKHQEIASRKRTQGISSVGEGVPLKGKSLDSKPLLSLLPHHRIISINENSITNVQTRVFPLRIEKGSQNWEVKEDKATTYRCTSNVQTIKSVGRSNISVQQKNMPLTYLKKKKHKRNMHNETTSSQQKRKTQCAWSLHQ